MRKKIAIAIFIFICISIFFIPRRTYSLECEQISDINQKISCLTQQVQNKEQTANTLKSEIQYMNNQISLATLKIQQTEDQITNTQKEIDTLESRIGGLDTSLTYLSKLLLQRIVDGYKQHSVSLLTILFGSDNANDLITKIKYQKTAQQNNQKLLVQVEETKLNFEEQKKLREQKIQELDNLKITLAQQQADLETQQQSKKNLLVATNNDETTYQNLLNQARAQLAGFSRFTSNQGGSSILSNQTVCDDWGCYYNQRDSQWGSNSLNGTGYTLASDGCLVTSMAMIYSHYGHRDVNPQTINSNPNNFASYYPAYLNFSIIANGVSSTRINSAIDSELSQGHPVVVEISLGGSDYHFVVLISGSGGNYQMNDPYVPNGHNISFTSKYPIGSIVAVQKVSF